MSEAVLAVLVSSYSSCEGLGEDASRGVARRWRVRSVTSRTVPAIWRLTEIAARKACETTIST